MIEAQGLLYATNRLYERGLKHRAIFFDKLFAVISTEPSVAPRPNVLADLDYLQLRGVVEQIPVRDVKPTPFFELNPHRRLTGDDLLTFGQDNLIYCLSEDAKEEGEDVVPIFQMPLPLRYDMMVFPPEQATTTKSVVEIALDALPVPSEDCSWEEIVDFKAELQHKKWSFRRFVRTLATQQLSEAEIRDTIEWTVNEYAREMDRFKLKRSVSFMETYIIPTVEALEGFRPSSFLKGLVSIKKRKIELLEVESKASGRECAYVFDARKRFGKL